MKLYIAYNMLEFADKLFSSFGQVCFICVLKYINGRSVFQDLLDSCMFLTSQNIKCWSRYDFLYFPGAILYFYCHAFLLLLQLCLLY